MVNLSELQALLLFYKFNSIQKIIFIDSIDIINEI
jgi:hypothetical protein